MGNGHDAIDITVEYVGKTPFHDLVHGDPTFQHIKLAAMKQFDLEPSAAGKYVLQDGDVDLSDSGHVSALDRTKATLTLILKDESVKG